MVGTDNLIVGLLETMEAAIRIGDWEVDGRCDPSLIMDIAAEYIREAGFTRDGITGEYWIKE